MTEVTIIAYIAPTEDGGYKGITYKSEDSEGNHIDLFMIDTESFATRVKASQEYMDKYCKILKENSEYDCSLNLYPCIPEERLPEDLL